jgi:hypothetical protein
MAILDNLQSLLADPGQVFGNPMFQAGIGMLAGNTGMTGRQAFANSLQGGMQGYQNARQQQLADMLRTLQMEKAKQDMQAQMQAKQAREQLQQQFPNIPEAALTPEFVTAMMKRQFLPPEPTSLMREAQDWMQMTPEQRQAAAQIAQINPRGTSVSVGLRLPPNIPGPPPGAAYTNPAEIAAGGMPQLGIMYGGPLDPKAQEPFRKQKLAIDNAQGSIARMLELTEQSGWQLLPGKTKEQMKAAMTGATKAVLDALGAGAPQEAELRFAAEAIGNPTKVREYIGTFGVDPSVKLREIQGLLKRSSENLAAQYTPSIPYIGAPTAPPVPPAPPVPQAGTIPPPPPGFKVLPPSSGMKY